MDFNHCILCWLSDLTQQISHTSWKTTNSFSRSWKCLWILRNQEMSCNKYCLWKEIHLEQKIPWLNIMPVEINFNCSRKEYRYIVMISHVSSNLNNIWWIWQLERVRRRLYHKNVNNRSYTWFITFKFGMS